MAQLTKQQVETILKNAPKEIDPTAILDGLINRGFELEGVDTAQAKARIEQKSKVLVPVEPIEDKDEGIIKDTVGDFLQIGKDILASSKKRAENIKVIRAGLEEGKKGNLDAIFQTVGQLAGAGSDAIANVFKGGAKIVLTPKAEQKVKEVVGTLGEKAMESEPVQRLITWYDGLDENAKARIDAVGGIVSLATDFIGAGAVEKGATAAKQTLKEGATVVKEGAENVLETTAKTAGQVKKAAGEVIPSADRVVNFQVSRALNLTQGDIKNIAKSTGNEVGEWLANKNLIMGSKDETLQAVQDFYKKSYTEVRDEIGKVSTTYKPSAVPRFKQALNEIKKQITEVPGLEESAKEIDALLKKKTITLNDVQRVKELMDEHFSLYKITGDVKESVVKEGLSNVRKDLKEFIENEVEDFSGADIRALNNDVATARSIDDAITTRSTRGLTQSQLKLFDIGAFGVGTMLGGPLGGLAAVAIKKVMGTSAIRLKFAKWLDGISDAKKVAVAAELQAGKVPAEIDALAKEVDIGATSFRGTPVNTVKETLAYYKTPRAKGFENFMKSTAEKNNISGNPTRVAGVWEGSIEPSFLIENAQAKSFDDALSYASQLGAKGNQDAVILFTPGEGKGIKYVFSNIANPDKAILEMQKVGISGGTVANKSLIVYDIDNTLTSKLQELSKQINAKFTQTKGEVKIISREEYPNFTKEVEGGNSAGADLPEKVKKGGEE